MLINCPRCGFSQPNDQYCAQCGVDMQAFKPKQEPALKKFFQSTGTHVFILLAAAVFVGQYVIRSDEPQRWVQKMTRFQSVSAVKSKPADESEQGPQVSSSQTRANSALENSSDEQLSGIQNKELSVNAATEEPIQASANSQPVSMKMATTSNGEVVGDISSPTFRITYAEVPTEVINRWVLDSSNAGLYQTLQDYSAGILADFRKKMDASVRVLKVSEKKLNLGQSDTNFSGTLSEEGGQMIGLAASIEYKSNENGIIHGTLMINRSQRQTRENFPAEFDLPKGSVFFMQGVLRIQSFGNERASLNMPPFQILKSPDFMTHKTEFVIIVEPEYK